MISTEDGMSRNVGGSQSLPSCRGRAGGQGVGGGARANATDGGRASGGAAAAQVGNDADRCSENTLAATLAPACTHPCVRVIEALWLVNGGHGAPLNISRHAGPSTHPCVRVAGRRQWRRVCAPPARATTNPRPLGRRGLGWSSQCQQFGHPPRPNDQSFMYPQARGSDRAPAVVVGAGGGGGTARYYY
jgi:hypothetical protein